MAKRPADNPVLRAEVNAQADRIASLLGIAPEEVMFAGYRVQLTVRQCEHLLKLAEAGHAHLYPTDSSKTEVGAIVSERVVLDYDVIR